MLLDNAPEDLVAKVILQTEKEKGRRLPIHGVHRWWSRRFSAVYRFILGAYLFEKNEDVIRAMINPKLMRERAFKKVYFEPFAGGGTGLVEAALAGFNVYGIDINPVAVTAARTSLRIVSDGLPKGFAESCERVLSEAQRKVRRIWEFKGNLVSYIFVSRGRIPTWLSVNNGKKVILCPRCYRIFETIEVAKSKITCPFCFERFEITSRPTAYVPSSAPKMVSEWRAFAVEVRWYNGKRWKKEYSSLADPELSSWLKDSVAEAQHLSRNLSNTLEEIAEVCEINRLKRAGIMMVSDIYAPHQLASFVAYSETIKDMATDDEYEFFATAASEASKCCNLLAKWYPPLGECTPAGGVKALWVPEYTAVTNPLASSGLIPLARGTIASALRVQIRAWHYVERTEGKSCVSSKVILGDAFDAAFPQHADLIVLDPPYGKIMSYASLSLPHYYILRNFNYSKLEFYDLKAIENREISLKKVDFQERWSTIVEKIARITDSDSRIVLMFSPVTVDLWKRILEPFRLNDLYPAAVYWVLGEGPSNITSSRVKGMNLVIFRKLNADDMGEIHVVQKEAIKAAKNVIKINENLEKRASLNLLTALRDVFSVKSSH